ncbi:MAG: hypothetical protein V3W31_03965 [Thermodesulfobacteriota bacterium]
MSIDKVGINKIEYTIGRTHMYWGRKPLGELLDAFKEVGEGDVVLDPFCGGGTPAIAARIKKARVIASDLNPMAVFITKVLLRSISIHSLKAAFEEVKSEVREDIFCEYAIKCPKCKKTTSADSFVWSGHPPRGMPKGVQIKCHNCGTRGTYGLSPSMESKQKKLSRMTPEFWFPKRRITSTRKPPVEYHHELFTGRNLSMLSKLLAAINKVSDDYCREALQYVFTAILYSCSNMQMFSEDSPGSSRGWTALRFYVPPKRKEKNVWKNFEERFGKMIKCKEMLNSSCHTRVAGSSGGFSRNKYEALVFEADASKAIAKFGDKANHVIVDPPYSEYVDYLGFSEFWGAWLKMRFRYPDEWKPQEQKAEQLKHILGLVGRKTSEKCSVSLLFAPKDPINWRMNECISDSGFYVSRRGRFSYSNTNKRGVRKGKVVDKKCDKFYVLTKQKEPFSNKTSPDSYSKENLALYFRVGAFYASAKDVGGGRDNIYRETGLLVPKRLRRMFRGLTDTEIDSMIKGRKSRRKSFYKLYLALINIILTKDGWEIIKVNKVYFENDTFGIALDGYKNVSDAEGRSSVAFVATNGERKIHFGFKEDILKRPTGRKSGNDDMRDVNVLLLITEKSMAPYRDGKKNNGLTKGGFFTSFENICMKAEELNFEKYAELCASNWQRRSGEDKASPIATATAEVIQNIPVGEDKKEHCKLKFSAPDLPKIFPGQFIMINTSPSRKKRAQRVATGYKELESMLDISPRAYIKRPFGIHRAFYPGFASDYLKNISLPPNLSTVLYTAKPSVFDIFYKVVGRGTSEMVKLKPGMKIDIIGPLGWKDNLRDVRSKGFEEVHIIGGGVGTAPLIFIVQALRFFAFDIKAFIGIESPAMLKYKNKSRSDSMSGGFTEDPGDAILYVDDLMEVGIKREDIYVSSDKGGDLKGIIPGGNFNIGRVGERYKKYLSKYRKNAKVLVISCGPKAMMAQIAGIVEGYKGIELKVLLEERMACGFGVCLSCVCELESGKSARVCVDGPVFDAKEIKWQ